MTLRFADKVALVTGAAAGLGRATAVRLAAEGARVFGVDVDAAGLAETRSACAGGAFESLAAEGVVANRGLATPEQVAEVIAFLASEQAARVHGAVWAVDAGVTAG